MTEGNDLHRACLGLLVFVVVVALDHVPTHKHLAYGAFSLFVFHIIATADCF